MWLRKVASLMNRGLLPLTGGASRTGAGFLAVMMLLTVVDVVGRRLFNHPQRGTLELSELMLIRSISLSIAHAELQRMHIKIDLVVERFRPRLQHVTDGIMYVFCLVTSVLLTWQLCVDALAQWHSGLTTGTLDLPIFYFIFIAALGFALFSLAILVNLLLFLAEALKR